jgi:hypothetical protein
MRPNALAAVTPLTITRAVAAAWRRLGMP